MPPAGMDHALLASADRVASVDDFKAWTRTAIRPVLPHRALACGLGHIHAGGVAIDYVVTVDYPVGHLESIRNRAGGIDTPILRRWLATRQPQLFEIDTPWPECPAKWVAHFREHDLRNAAAHACYDSVRCVGTYFSFHRIPAPLGEQHRIALVRIVPVMHEVMQRVIAAHNDTDAFPAWLAALTPREKEILAWLRLGKTNGDIAHLEGLSESTVKHHMTRIFSKLGVENRARLIGRLAQQAAPAPGYGTRIL